MNWELKGREVKHTKDLPEGTIGFVYIIHLSNGKKYKKYLRFKLGIKSVESHGKGVMRSLILKEPNVSYTTDNFLPKLSVKKS